VSNVHFWIVVADEQDFRGGESRYSVHDFPNDAIDAAKRQTDADRAPRQVFECTLIGTTNMPQAQFHDQRAKAAETR
jgi:hypothetical protein